MDDFNAYVDWCAWNGWSSPSAYRIDHAMQSFIKWARDVDPMKETLPDPIIPSKIDRRKGMNGKLLLSLDMSNANYSVMRWMATRRGLSVPESWTNLCALLGFHPFLATSKTFRQYCFGNYMPSRYATLQKHVMGLVCKHLNITDETAIFISHDEVVVEYPEQEGYTNFMMRVERAIGDEGLSGIIKIKGTVYESHGVSDSLLSRVVNEGASVDELLAESVEERTDSSLKTQYEYGPYEKDGLTVVGLHQKKKVLVGVSSNKFYAYLRIVLLKETLHANDLIFMHEDMPATWLLSEVKNGRKASKFRVSRISGGEVR